MFIDKRVMSKMKREKFFANQPLCDLVEELLKLGALQLQSNFRQGIDCLG